MIKSKAHTENQKGKKRTHKMTNAHARYTRLTEWTALSKTGGHSATRIKSSSNIYFTYFLLQVTKYNQTGSIMDSCYTGYHTAGDHIHVVITKCNKEEQKKT